MFSKLKNTSYVLIVFVLAFLLSMGVFSRNFNGDVNLDGETNVIDALVLNMHLSKGNALTEKQLRESDCNEDGAVDEADLISLFCIVIFGVNSPEDIPREECSVDFTVDVETGKDIKILQIADIQIISLNGVRTTPNNTRYNQVKGAFFTDDAASHDDYTRTFRYVEEGIEEAKPDLIVLTGDNIYGQTDDSGEDWLAICNFLDSYEIPWAVTFGNHDNESAKGVRWQIEQVEKSKYGIIKQGDVTGNANYTIGIRQGNTYKYIVYMIDTNGCHTYSNPGEGMNHDNVDIKLIKQEAGIYSDQIEWMKETYKTYTEELNLALPTIICMHIPPIESLYAVSSVYFDTYGTFPLIPHRNGDMGISYEAFGGFVDGGKFWACAKFINCTDILMGHQHKIATSIAYDGIRLTYGLKTGTYDYHHEDLLGTTEITISKFNRKTSVRYLKSKLQYSWVPH